MILSRSKVSKGFLTVVPRDVRRASNIEEGDLLEWAIEKEGTIVVRPRRRRTIEDITGLIAAGGDAVADKRRLQRGQRARR